MMSVTQLCNEFPYYAKEIQTVYGWALDKGRAEKDVLAAIDRELEDIVVAVGGIDPEACERYLRKRLDRL